MDGLKIPTQHALHIPSQLYTLEPGTTSMAGDPCRFVHPARLLEVPNFEGWTPKFSCTGPPLLRAVLPRLRITAQGH